MNNKFYFILFFLTGCISEIDFNQKSVSSVDSVTAVSLGYKFGCAIDSKTGLSCWEKSNQIVAIPKDLGQVKHIQVSNKHACVIIKNGLVRCWAIEDLTPIKVPEELGMALAISSDKLLDKFCAIRKIDNSILCWSSLNSPNTSIRIQDLGPAEKLSLSSTGDFLCVIPKNNHILNCRHDDHLGHVSEGSIVPNNLGPVRDFSAGLSHTCAITHENSLTCFGAYNHSSNAPEGSVKVPELGKVISIASGPGTICAILENESLRCWAGRGDIKIPGDLGLVTQVSIGWDQICAIRKDGSIRCWKAEYS